MVIFYFIAFIKVLLLIKKQGLNHNSTEVIFKTLPHACEVFTLVHTQESGDHYLIYGFTNTLSRQCCYKPKAGHPLSSKSAVFITNGTETYQKLLSDCFWTGIDVLLKISARFSLEKQLKN